MPVVGFNHNINHKGKVYHIQTEDSGVATPHIITLLYVGGTILAREKTSYADIIKVIDLASVVRELMEEQHKKMLKKLVSGTFDEPSQATPSPDTPPPLSKEEEKKKFGGDIISEKGLDEVILSFLATDVNKDK